MLPPRKKPAKSGIARAPRREWPRHRKWVRSHICIVPFCERDPIEFSHIRTAANSGTGIKPADWSAVSMCQHHPREYHNCGHDTFEARYGLNLAKLAAEFAHYSPDAAMKEAMREAR